MHLPYCLRVRFPYGSPKIEVIHSDGFFFCHSYTEPSHRFSHRPFLTYDSAKSLRQTAVNFLPVLPHCTKFCRRKSRRVEQENTGWNSRKRCAIICPKAKTDCNMMKNKKKEGSLELLLQSLNRIGQHTQTDLQFPKSFLDCECIRNLSRFFLSL